MRVIINIDVPVLAPAIAFYSHALGLRCNRILDDDVAELSGADTCIYLLANDAGSCPTHSGSDRRRYDRHWTPVHVDLVVNNLAEASQRAIAAGAIQESGCIAWRCSQCISFSDPFGHGFCLIEFSNVTYAGDGP